MELGKKLSQTSDLLVDLILAESDVEKKKKLRKLLNRNLVTTGELVEKNVNKETVKYKEASKKMAEAITAIKEAIKDIEKVAETIKKVASAIDFAAKVAGDAT